MTDAAPDATPAVSSYAYPAVDVVCLGESMVVLRPDPPASLARADAFARGTGGAESNVACALARTGHRARWISRLGTDGFGDHLLATIAATGVDTSAVQRDPDRPTGVYFRTHGDRDSTLEVAYYRAGSAASALSPALVPLASADAGRVLHLTGITPALSASCEELLYALTAPRPNRPLLSFDLNYRAHLWTYRDRDTLLTLARRADLAFVGADEAALAWGTTPDAAAVRALLPQPATLVVKQGAEGATVFARAADTGEDRALHMPPPRVDVVAPVGAGDAFAAGYLSATLRGLPFAARLRHGHLGAAAALTDAGDLAPPPSRTLADRLATLDERAWGDLRLGPGWTTSAGPSGSSEPSCREGSGGRDGSTSGPAAGSTPRTAPEGSRP